MRHTLGFPEITGNPGNGPPPPAAGIHTR